MDDALTDAELALIGLVAERPRHPYELESLVEERGMRDWTPIAFSSIYYVLDKLEHRGLLRSTKADDAPRSRRVFEITDRGVAACRSGALAAIRHVAPGSSAVLLGLACAPMLDPGELRAALRERASRIDARLAALIEARAAQEAAPPHVAGIFDHGIELLSAEARWLSTLDIPTRDEP